MGSQVTLGLVLVGAVKPLRGLAIFPTQIVAGIAAAAVTHGLLPGPLKVANTLGGGINRTQGLFLEMFLTAQLVLTVYFLAVEKHRGTFLAPIGIGISVFIAHIAATNWTGTSINPARSFGPACIVGFTDYQWIYWLGPFMGSLLAFGAYTAFKWLEYQTANPGQDDDGDVERGHHFSVRANDKTMPPGSRLDDIPSPMNSPTKPRVVRNDSVIDGQISPGY